MIILSKGKIVYSAAFVALILLFSISACSKDDDPSQYASEPAVLTVAGKTIEVPYAMIIDGAKISLDEYRYHFLNAKIKMDQGDDAYWKKDTDGSQQRNLKYQTETALKESYAIRALAKEHQLTLTSDEKEQIATDVKGQIETLGGAEEYRDALETAYLTDELYREIWKTSYQYEKLYQYYFSQDGDFHNADTTIENEDKELGYQAKLQAIISKKADELTVTLGPEYDLIRVDTLY